MPVVGITGSVATGKSTACRLTADLLGAEVFDADLAVRQLLRDDPAVKAKLIELLGSDVVNIDGALDRALIRERVFSNPIARKGLESILHPRVRSLWERFVAAGRVDSNHWLLLDIPLLYETNAEVSMDIVVVTACSRRTQMRRLTSGRSLTPGMAKSIVDSQTAQESKLARADCVLWTDSTIEILEEQVHALAASITKIDE